MVKALVKVRCFAKIGTDCETHSWENQEKYRYRRDKTKVAKVNDQACTWVELGDSYRSLEWYEMEIQDYEEAIKVGADNPAIWRRLAETHERVGQLRRAVELLEEAVRARPGDPQFWYLLGACYHRRQSYVKVHEVLSTLRKLDAA